MINFKYLIILLHIFSFASIAQNHFYLTVGTTRYYDGCQSYGIPCVDSYTHLGVEKIVGDTLIDTKVYSIVNFESEKILWDLVTIQKDTSYFYFENGLLYKYTANGDSVVQDFTFSKGDTVCKFYSEEDLSSFHTTPPTVIIYDTVVNFTDGSANRIIWGDDTTHIYIFEPTIIPDIQTFVDSILIDRGETWLLPFGEVQTYYPYKPFYFVDSLGILYSEWNYRKMALVGIKKPNGPLYGQEVNFITNIKNQSSKVELCELYQNYPNPFNPSTIINYQLPMSNDVELSVYNLLGQKVATLVSEKQKAGYHQVKWDASNMASGVYLYRIESNGFTSTKKMLFVR